MLGSTVIGATVSHYRVVQKIGTGGMGVVYRAEDSRLGRQVAIKFLATESPEGAAAAERFKRELRAAAALNHPNICTIHDTGEYDGHLFMVMELLEGESLDRRLREGEVPSGVCLDWAIEMVAGLAEAHARGIVHRDIKPSNLFVTKLNHVKILDFGVAKWTEPGEREEASLEAATATTAYRTSPGAVVGTPSYMSPEQVAGVELDARADLFAFGIVLYEMATGAAPFTGRTPNAITAAILYQAHEPASQWNPQIPAELERIINRLLEKNPDARYQQATDVVEDLRRLKRSLDVRAAVSGTVAGTKQRRTRWAVATAASVLLLGAGYWSFTAAPMPHPGPVTQVTNDGEEKDGLVTDGSRVYYVSRSSGGERLLQVSLNGGDPVAMPDNLSGMFPLDLSPVRGELLLADRHRALSGEITPQDPVPLFAASTVGGTPRRLGDLVADTACWSPAGDRIALAKGRDILIASADGNGARKLYTAEGAVSTLSWSPDGRLRFAVGDENSKLWELPIASGPAHRAFPERDDSQDGGDWFGNGRYFLFSAGKGRRADLLVREERAGFPRMSRHITAAADQRTDGVLPAESDTGRRTDGFLRPVGEGKTGPLRSRQRGMAAVPLRAERGIRGLRGGRQVDRVRQLSRWRTLARQQRWRRTHADDIGSYRLQAQMVAGWERNRVCGDDARGTESHLHHSVGRRRGAAVDERRGGAERRHRSQLDAGWEDADLLLGAGRGDGLHGEAATLAGGPRIGKHVAARRV